MTIEVTRPKPCRGVAAGRFASAGELIRKTVEDLERRERERDAVIAELNREIEVGGRRADPG